MGILSVLVAAVGAFAFGAAWYMTMSKAWMDAAGIVPGPDGRPANGSNPMPFIVGIAAMIVVAGMMRHIFAMAAIDGAGKGLLSGLGIGAFLVVPWLAMNYAFAMRNSRLTMIDGVNVIVGCGIMGLILALF